MEIGGREVTLVTRQNAALSRHLRASKRATCGIIPLMRRLESLGAMTGFALAIWIFATTVNIARTGWVPIPILDDWDRWVAFLTDHYTLEWFFQQHFDHRIASAKLLFVVDHVLFHARGWFLLVCSFCFQALTGMLLWRLAGAAYAENGSGRLMQAAVVVSCLFSGQQWFNFVLPFQVQFIMVYSAAAAALFALWRSAENDWSVSWILTSVAMAIVANYSMANGVLVWPVLILAAVWLRMPWKWIGALAGSGLAIGALYFYHWQRTPFPNNLAIGQRFVRTGLFWLIHMGAPLAPMATPYDMLRNYAALPGAILAIALAVGLVMLWRRSEWGNSARGILLFYCTFIAASSASIAYGRSELALSKAFAWRYLTPSYLLWTGMLLVEWPVLRKVPSAALYGLLSTLIFAGIAVNQANALKIVTSWAATIRLGEVGVADNVTDPAPWRSLYYEDYTPRLQSVMSVVDYLREHNLALFNEEWTHWPGTPLKSRFAIDSTPGVCQGEFQDTIPVTSPLRSGWRSSGWAWDNRAARPPRYVILVDDNGFIAGVALTGFSPSAALTAGSLRHATATWNGYVSGPAKRITAYALETYHRSLCAIGVLDASSQRLGR
jgi:hypothetical protein